MPIPCTPPDNCCAPISGIRRRQFPHRSKLPYKVAVGFGGYPERKSPELSVSLDSIATQTHDSIEVLLIDVNGRREFETPILCGSFPVRLISSGRHLSRGEAANAGLDAAGGEYTVFLDDDDWFQPDHIATLVHALEVGQPALAAYSGVACCTSSAIPVPGKRPGFSTHTFDPIRLLVENYLPIHAVMFASSLIGPKLRFEEDFDVYEDWDFWIQLSQLTPFLHVDRITAIYRISQTSGFGLRAADSAIALGTKKLFGKWHKNWSESQVVGFIEYQKKQIQQQHDETRRRDSELKRRHELLVEARRRESDGMIGSHRSNLS